MRFLTKCLVAILAVAVVSGSKLPQTRQYDYGDVLGKSMLFYEANRSGPLPDDQRVTWRGDSGMNDDVLGGYYDAGDHVKFGFPMAASMTFLAYGGVSFKDGYDAAGESENLMKTLKWGTDYFIKCHTSDYEFVGQIGDGNADHAFWGRPEDMTMDRPSWKITQGQPGSDLAGETAAALAASSMFYDMMGDSSAASEALAHARTLFDFADKYRGIYTDAIPANGFYNSWSGYNDELGWAAAWLAKVTGEQEYMDKAKDFYSQFSLGDRPMQFSWDDKKAGVQLLMAELFPEDSQYSSAVESYTNYLINEAPYSPGGMIYLDQWGSLRHAGNAAMVCLQAAALNINKDACINFASSQIGYILGDHGRSFVCGVGNNPPTQPHHRGSSCPDRPEVCDWQDFDNPGPNPQVLYGALVGGPDNNDGYYDDRHDFTKNEVACDYNAGFQGALAGLLVYGK